MRTRPGEYRAVIRYDVTPQASCCVAVSLTKHYVVSVWFNRPDDTHDTLDHNGYRWQVDLKRVIYVLEHPQEAKKLPTQVEQPVGKPMPVGKA